MKDLIRLITDPKINEISRRLEDLSKLKYKNMYNIFTLSSYNCHYENFHNDIFASLLDPEGLHGEKDLFLKEFFYYMNIDPSGFEDAKVHRESGRLDIMIAGQVKAIIIENKINDADDADDQLGRYYDWCMENGYNVEAILYITLRGMKNPPPVRPEMEKNIRRVAVFTNNKHDMINGWIRPCISKCLNIETVSLLIQYCKLITYLGFKSMEKKTMDDFYAIADENDFIRNLKAVNELAMRIPSHRAEKCQASLTDYAPFKRSKLYLETSVLFFDYQEDNNNFKLDLNFFEDGRAEAVFWNPGKRDEEGTQALKRKVQKIRFEENIKLDGTVFRKRFDLGDYPNMNSIDTAIYEFAKGLFAALQLN